MSDARARTPQPAPASGSDVQLTADDQAALAEDVDLDIEMRRRVVHTHRSLARTNHYELLGVDRSADPKVLKGAYFQLASTFHPDRYFRKQLGSFKPRLESIFGRVSLAYETLSNGDARREYDAYLGEQQRAQAIEKLLADAVAEAKLAEESIEREVRAQTSTPPGVAPRSSIPSPPAPSTGAAGRPAVTPTAMTPSIDVTTRRDALARRLLGGRGSSIPPSARTSLAPPPSPTVADAMDALRRRYEERVTRAKASQARKYALNAEAALAAGDAVAAANAFRVAISLTPTDPVLADSARGAQAKADAVLSETYRRQAAYEEKMGQWVEAARSWTRVCKARPNDAEAHEHAAIAITKAGGDLHEASRLASHACIIEPGNARYRVALANVYFAADLVLNAKRELETAAQLAPHDGTIQAMMKGVVK